jgi:hypothetical protein
MTGAGRSQRVEQSRVQAQLSVQELWLHYISLSGVADLLEVDAYLHGLFTLSSYQEDKLCYAVNEQLDELHDAARLPYSSALEPVPVAEDPLDVLDELLEAARRARAAVAGAVGPDASDGSDGEPQPPEPA